MGNIQWNYRLFLYTRKVTQREHDISCSQTLFIHDLSYHRISKKLLANEKIIVYNITINKQKMGVAKDETKNWKL